MTRQVWKRTNTGRRTYEQSLCSLPPTASSTSSTGKVVGSMQRRGVSSGEKKCAYALQVEMERRNRVRRELYMRKHIEPNPRASHQQNRTARRRKEGAKSVVKCREVSSQNTKPAMMLCGEERGNGKSPHRADR